MEYNREMLSSGRRELGALLQVEEGKVFTECGKAALKVSVEFRAHGILIYSRSNNFSDRIDLSQIRGVDFEYPAITEDVPTGTFIALQFVRDASEEKIFLELEYPDFILTSLKKMVDDHQKKAGENSGEKHYSAVLRELNSLYKEGIISESEFNEKKATVLKKMTDI